MSAADRYDRPAPRLLSRIALVARITVLQDAVHSLWLQAKYDGGATFPCIGAMKGVLIDMENDLRARDKAAEQGEPLPQEVAEALAGRRS
jgi:hypothetical protein